MTILSVPDMSCGHCKASVEATLATVPGATEVVVDLDGRTVRVGGPARTATLIDALSEIGFPATVIAP